MSVIREAAAEYLGLRRSTGYKYYVEGLLIGQFVDFLEERRAEHVTAEAALEWAARPADADPAWHAARLTAIRGLIRHLAASDSRHQVPPPGLLPRRSHRVTPYLYSPEEITALVRAYLTSGGDSALEFVNLPVELDDRIIRCWIVFSVNVEHNEAELAIDGDDVGSIVSAVDDQPVRLENREELLHQSIQ